MTFANAVATHDDELAVSGNGEAGRFSQFLRCNCHGVSQAVQFVVPHGFAQCGFLGVVGQVATFFLQLGQQVFKNGFLDKTPIPPMENDD
jgi:hypothetical protein